MLEQIQKKFHSLIKSLEIIYVIENAKPCARILVFEDDKDKISIFLQEKSLEFSVSSFKIAKQTGQNEFYSDKSFKLEKHSGKKGHFIFYISKNKELCENARMAEEKNQHNLLGKILGYPECCCDFFEKHFNEKNTDLTLDALDNSFGLEFPFCMNIAARHFDASLLSHFPCSFNCKHSIEIAKNNLRIIKGKFPAISELFLKMLNSAVIYSSEEGVFLLRRFEKKGYDLIYGDILGTQKSKLYYLLASNSSLEIINQHEFIVAGEKISGKSYGVMVFI